MEAGHFPAFMSSLTPKNHLIVVCPRSDFQTFKGVFCSDNLSKSNHLTEVFDLHSLFELNEVSILEGKELLAEEQR